MRVIDYLNQLNPSDSVTFTIAKSVKDDNTPFYHNEFYQTPINSVWEWKKMNDSFLNNLVVKKDSAPIDISGLWDIRYKKGWTKCCIIESEESLKTMYSEKQAQDMIEWYEKTIK